MLRLVVIWVALTLASTASVRAEELSPQLEMSIHLNVLSFDTGLKDRVAGDTLTIGIVHATDPAAKINAEKIASALAALGDQKTVHRKKVRVALVPYASDFASRLNSVNVVYVANSLPPDQVANIANVAMKRKLPTLCSKRENLEEGIAVAVVAKDKKPAIVVQIENAKQQGMLIDSKFMRLVEIVK